MFKRIAKYIICQVQRIKWYGKCKIHPSCIVLGDCDFEGRNKLSEKTYFRDSRLGYASYVGARCEFNRSLIGKYCSIGNNVIVVTGTHPLANCISTHPFFYSSDSHSFSYVDEVKFSELLSDDQGNCLTVGNDVWIGDNVLIKGGISIGDGAVIAMGAVVTKDVLPYSIVGGVPAKVIKYRFDKTDIEHLLGLKWWNKPEEWIKEHARSFSDAESFLMNTEDSEPHA